MQRPVMNPRYYDEAAAPRVKSKWRLILRLFSAIVRLFRMFFRVLLSNPLARRQRYELKVEVGTRLGRMFRGLMYRLMFAPALLVLLMAAVVWVGTHPPRALALVDPVTQGIYYEPVNFHSGDGVRLEGWLVPGIDASRVLKEGDAVLTNKHPAVVMVHDFGASAQQMLPLVGPLHETGLTVLVVSLRGSGASGAAGHTFGLREAQDVQAAVKLLRGRMLVDPRRIAVIGVGTGANAAVLAADRDNGIAALVLENPVQNFDDVLVEHIIPKQSFLRWMQPLCRWTFEIAYRVDAESLNLVEHEQLLGSRPVLQLGSAAGAPSAFSEPGIAKIKSFLDEHLKD